jgi:hypothetical protein
LLIVYLPTSTTSNIKENRKQQKQQRKKGANNNNNHHVRGGYNGGTDNGVATRIGGTLYGRIMPLAGAVVGHHCHSALLTPSSSSSKASTLMTMQYATPMIDPLSVC